LDKWHEIYLNIVKSPFYAEGIKYGKPRRGHAEGTVAAHIDELNHNLEILDIGNAHYWKLKVLIAVHDTFKGVAKRDAAIMDPQSHASLAKDFLEEFTSDFDMLQITQYHDLGYAVYLNYMKNGEINEKRMRSALDPITDIDLFLWFAIIDACTASKGREMITWLVGWVNHHYPQTTVMVKDILPASETVEEGVW
jgi:hypothetical protein